VQRSLVRPTHGLTWLVEEPKTDKSRRAVPSLHRTVDALKWHRTRQDAERMTSGGEYADHGFVFAMPSGEPLQGTVVYKYHWLPTLKRLGLPKIRLHDLRHSAATLCRLPAAGRRRLGGTSRACKYKTSTGARFNAVSYCPGPSSNGRTADFGSVNGGSNPPGPTRLAGWWSSLVAQFQPDSPMI